MEESDPDVLEDPLYQINLKAEIQAFVKGLVASNMPLVQQIGAQLTAEEQQTLQKIAQAQPPQS